MRRFNLTRDYTVRLLMRWSGYPQLESTNWVPQSGVAIEGPFRTWSSKPELPRDSMKVWQAKLIRVLHLDHLAYRAMTMRATNDVRNLLAWLEGASVPEAQIVAPGFNHILFGRSFAARHGQRRRLAALS
jgi:hypothetical protein